MATYKMLTTKKGVRKGDVHPVTFEKGKTYEIDDDLAGEFEGAVEPSKGEISEATPEGDAGLHENWLDTDPAVLRHGELTAQEVVARDESAEPQTTNPPEQVEGRAEGEKSSGDAPENKKKAKKAE